MTWTTMRPHRTGHYWYKNNCMSPDIVEVCCDGDSPYVIYLGMTCSDSLDDCVKAVGAMWSGPIPEP